MNQMSGTGAPPVMPSGPKSFFQVSMDAITKPSEATFAEIAASPNARASTAYLWVFIGLLVEFFFLSLVQGAAWRGILQQQGLGGSLPAGGFGATLITAICGGPIMAVVSTIFFAIGIAIIQWIARMFGGTGTFDQMAYAFGAILAPFYLVSTVFALLSAIPLVGLCFSIVSFLILIYVIVLEVMAVKGVNHFGWGAAIGSLFIPALVIGFLCACIAIVSLMALGPVIGNVFSTINQSLTAP